MSEITKIVRTRKSFLSLINKKEDYNIYAASNGEEFPTRAAALKYQKRIDYFHDFKQYFDFDKGKNYVFWRKIKTSKKRTRRIWT